MGRSAAGTPAIRVLTAARVPHTVHAYEHDPRAVAAGLAYGAEAAAALGVDQARVLKTLVVAVEGAAAFAVAVLPVAERLDLKAVAAAFGGRRAVLAQARDAERVTGYVVGGISPLGQRRALPTVVDDSVISHATVLVSAGRRGLDVELAPHELVRLTGALTCEITRGRARPLA